MPKSYAQATIPYPNPDSPPDNVVVRPVVEAFDLPEGWEPFAGDSFGSILARQCIKPAP
ncbi:hypothetical protein WMF31_38685 [Sorangium sp. So ce1036]|uniref:hypothetical protein n=1 Tax=Sorangium sp. So ce1036 TaxID=3133328 RepID=UPI003F021D5D